MPTPSTARAPRLVHWPILCISLDQALVLDDLHCSYLPLTSAAHRAVRKGPARPIYRLRLASIAVRSASSTLALGRALGEPDCALDRRRHPIGRAR